MAKTASTPTFPTFPAINLDALVALQKANLETAAQVQKILTDAVDGIWQLYLKRMGDWRAQAEAAIKGFDARRQPETYAADAKAALETVIADAKTTVETGVKAQQQMGAILSQRFVANLDELKALAA
jgi:hypothetical protein